MKNPHFSLLRAGLLVLMFLPAWATAQLLSSGGVNSTSSPLGVGSAVDNGIQLKVHGGSTRSGIFVITTGSNKYGLYARADNASCYGVQGLSLNGIGVRGYSTNGKAGVFDGDFQLRHSGTFTPYFSAQQNGLISMDGPVAVGVVPGTSDPDYLLYVQKGIQTGRLKTLASLADYVFAPDYALMPLPEVADYIATHRHLPGVISQAEVDAAGGLELTAFTVQLQEKLEELYLHVIALQQEVAALKAENAALRAASDDTTSTQE